MWHVLIKVLYDFQQTLDSNFELEKLMKIIIKRISINVISQYLAIRYHLT
jgi:hypothetical protein